MLLTWIIVVDSGINTLMCVSHMLTYSVSTCHLFTYSVMYQCLCLCENYCFVQCFCMAVFLVKDCFLMSGLTSMMHGIIISHCSKQRTITKLFSITAPACNKCQIKYCHLRFFKVCTTDCSRFISRSLFICVWMYFVLFFFSVLYLTQYSMFLLSAV